MLCDHDKKLYIVKLLAAHTANAPTTVWVGVAKRTATDLRHRRLGAIPKGPCRREATYFLEWRFIYVRPKGDQRATQGRPKGDPRATQGRPKVDPRSTQAIQCTRTTVGSLLDASPTDQASVRHREILPRSREPHAPASRPFVQHCCSSVLNYCLRK